MIPLALLTLGCAHTSVLDGVAGDRVDEIAAPPAAFEIEDFQADGEATGICTGIGDEGLWRLQDRLVEESLDLQGAVARLSAAEARAREAGAPLKPRADLTLQATRTTLTIQGLPGSTALTRYQPSLAVSYEIDAWGKLRNRRKAALLDAEASAEDYRSLAITLSARLAEVWFGILAERELIALLGDQKETSERFLELTKFRFGQGLGPAQDIGRQKEQILSLEGRIELAHGRLTALKVQLATLLGTTATAAPESPVPLSDLIRDSGLPELGLPGNLLEQRPDLVAASRQLEASDRRLAAAVKEWFPSLSLSASLFDLRTTIGKLFEDLLWQVAVSVGQGLYEGGARGARIEQARAVAEQDLYFYAQSLVVAVGEVHSAVALDRSQREFLDNLQLRLEEAHRTLDLTRESYRQGATDYLNVLTALLSEQSLEQQLIDARRQQLTNRVQLCRALGFPSGVASARLVPRPSTIRSPVLSAEGFPLSSAMPRGSQ
jgi:NodT family efflux transporter outer membrane factor (OMF) lipoprotein